MSQNLKLKATTNNEKKVITNIKETQERKGGMGEEGRNKRGHM